MEQAILHWARGHGHIVLAVASTGIAALLLEGGNTVHSAFRVPLTILPDSRLNIGAQTAIAKLVRRASAILYDEAAPHSVHILNAIDLSFRDLRSDNRPFGGISVLMAGDFRQTLPIEVHASDAVVVSLCLHQWSGWKDHVKVFELHENQRCMRLLEKAVDDEERNSILRWKLYLERATGNIARVPPQRLRGRGMSRILSDTCDQSIKQC